MDRNLLSLLTGVLTLSGLMTQIAAQQPAAPRKDNAATAAAASAEEQGRVTRARDLLGMELVLQSGETYGMIDDLMINKKSGQIEFVLVATEDDAKELYPLPWKTLALYRGDDPQDQYLIIGMDRQRFEQAPTIVRQQWPAMTYTQWNTFVPQVTTYYRDVRPVEARAIRRAARAARRALD